MLTEELERENMKLTSLVEQGDAIKAQRLKKQWLKSLPFDLKHRIISKHYTFKGRGIVLIILGFSYNFPHGREVLLQVFPIDEPLV